MAAISSRGGGGGGGGALRHYESMSILRETVTP